MVEHAWPHAGTATNGDKTPEGLQVFFVVCMSYGTTPNKKTGVKYPTRKSATASYPSLGTVGQDAKENPTTIQQIMLKGSEDSGLSVDKAITRRRREEERGREKKNVKCQESACQHN